MVKSTKSTGSLGYLSTQVLGFSVDLHNFGGYRYAILSDSHNNQQQSTKSSTNVYSSASAVRIGCDVPAGLRAGMGVACAVGLWPGQRRAEIVGVRLIINGAEDQARLVA